MWAKHSKGLFRYCLRYEDEDRGDRHGISGLGAAYALSKGHEVELSERDGRAGGHSNTVEHVVAGRTLRLDTGFIVHNEDTYPNLVRLFRELGVRIQPSEMSFSVRSVGAKEGATSE